MSSYKPKCYCTSILLPNGTCRFKCPPDARRPGARARKTESVLAEREKKIKITFGINVDDASRAVAKFDPKYAKKVEDLSRRQLQKRKRSVSSAQSHERGG